MRSRTAVVVVLLCLPGLLAGWTTDPAEARSGHRHHRDSSPRLALTSSATSVLDGTAVSLSGSSRGAVRGSATLLEASGGTWRRVARLGSTRRYDVTVTPTVGTHTYRTAQRTTTGRLVRSPSVTLTVLPRAAVSPELAAARSRILADTNAYRAQAGLAPLVETDAVDAVAQRWTAQMAGTGVFEHNPDYAAQIPAGWSRAGENIAYGYLPESVTAAWFASPGHRANLLGDFTTIGIGFAEDANGRGYYTQDFGRY